MKLLTWNINGLRATTFSGNFSDFDVGKDNANIDNDGAMPSSAKTSSVKSLEIILSRLGADIICFQEVKTPRDQLEESLALIPGFTSFFSFCRKKSAYSGVTTYSKDFCSPFRVEEGLSGILTTNATSDGNDLVGSYGDLSGFSKEELKELDSEGRSLITQHRIADGSILTIINVYCPYGGEEGERTDFKMKFYELLRIRASSILASGSQVVIVGDINTSHHLIDHCEGDTREPKEFYENPGRKYLSHLLKSPSKFDQVLDHESQDQKLDQKSHSCDDRPSENQTPCNRLVNYEDTEDSEDDCIRSCSDRRCFNATTEGDTANDLNSNLEQHLFSDAFRIFHPDRKEAFTCWNTSIGARATNYGTRIDYIFPDVGLTQKALKACEIMPHVKGSDHCPVIAEFDLPMVHPEKCPPSATKFWPEYAGGKQRTIGSFFGKKSEMCDQSGRSGAGGGAPSMKRSEITEAKRSKIDDKKVKPKPKTMLDFMTQRKRKSDDGIDSCSVSGGNSQTSSTSSFSSSSSSQQSFSEKDNEANDTGKTECYSNSQSVLIKNDSAGAWKKLLKGPGVAPNCKGHGEPCVANKVKKAGPNLGKTFYACRRPTGHASNKEARCNHFEWAKK